MSSGPFREATYKSGDLYYRGGFQTRPLSADGGRIRWARNLTARACCSRAGLKSAPTCSPYATSRSCSLPWFRGLAADARSWPNWQAGSPLPRQLSLTKQTLYARLEIMTQGGRCCEAGSLRPDVRLTNDAAILVECLMQIRDIVCTADTDRIEALSDKLRFQLRGVQSCREPACQLRVSFGVLAGAATPFWASASMSW